MVFGAFAALNDERTVPKPEHLEPGGMRLQVPYLTHPKIYAQLETHYILLKIAYEQSIDIAYAGLLKKKDILELLYAKITDNPSQLIRRFLEAKNIFEAFDIVREDLSLFNQLILVLMKIIEDLAGEKEDVKYFIQNRLGLLQEIIQKEVRFRPKLSSTLLQIHCPHTLKEVILANPQITDDSILLSLNALHSQLEVSNKSHLAQALQLRINEIQRLKKLMEPKPSGEQDHLPMHFHAVTGGTAINTLQGDLNIFHVEKPIQPEKSWWKPILPKMDKSFVGRTVALQALLRGFTPKGLLSSHYS